MKQLVLLALLLLIPLIPTSIAQDQDSFVYQKYDGATQEWINLTIAGSEAMIASDRLDLQVAREFHNWYLILVHLPSMSDLEADLENYTTRIVIETTERSAEWRLSPEMDLDIQASEILARLTEVFQMVTSYGLESNVWVSSVSMLVMESYPPQYGIEIRVQRGNDALTVVEDASVMMYAAISDSEGDLEDLSWVAQAPEIQTKQVSITSGGGSDTISFDTFSIGSAGDNLNYSQLVLLFKIEEYSLHFHPESGLISVDEGLQLPEHQILPVRTPEPDTAGGPLPVPWFGIIVAMIAVPLSRKYLR